jgi:NAD+ synthase
MNCESVKNQIVAWLQNYQKEAKADGFVVGVSGGVDSGLVSTLCAMAGQTLAVSLPIPLGSGTANSASLGRASGHIVWLSEKYPNTQGLNIYLKDVYDESISTLTDAIKNSKEQNCLNDFRDITLLAKANLQSRLRMLTLYALANTANLLVVGTGNRVEDYGVGFFTKYGDGGVDLSPIGDLTKTEVRALATYLGVSQEIVNAIPTDGLWEDNRSDESQLGVSYADLEKAMAWCLKMGIETEEALDSFIRKFGEDYQTLVFPGTEEETLRAYLKRHEASRHKMEMPPVCKVDKT